MKMIQTFSEPAQRIGPAAQGTVYGLCCLLCLIGCATAKVNSGSRGTFSSQQPAAASSGTIEVTRRSRWEFEEVSGTRTPVLVPLPKAGHWQVDDQRTTWWVASNPALGMRVEAKLWPERRLVTWQQCLADLGRWRHLPAQPVNSGPLQSKDLSVPAGFSSHLWVHVTQRDPGTSRTGTVVLVGADVARCFALWTTVDIPGASDEDELLARVALVTEGVVPRVRLRGVEQRINTKAEH